MVKRGRPSRSPIAGGGHLSTLVDILLGNPAAPLYKAILRADRERISRRAG